MAIITAVLRPEIMRVKELAMVSSSGYYLAGSPEEIVNLKKF